MARAGHLIIDSHRAGRPRAAWPPGARVPLELVDCSGQSLARCADLILHKAEVPGTEVTVILPRQSIAAPSGTAGQIADALNQVPAVPVLARCCC